jgi:hypothetical protein
METEKKKFINKYNNSLSTNNLKYTMGTLNSFDTSKNFKTFFI